ncbi:MAG: hypothetical protein QE484_11550 [Rhizobium sp.]|nr:hypothetical protein [Rhizobium sp.]
MWQSGFFLNHPCKVQPKARSGLHTEVQRPSESGQIDRPGLASQQRGLRAARTQQAEPENAVSIRHPIDQQVSQPRMRQAHLKPDPWKDPLEGEEWNGLHWFIDVLVWIRRATDR